MPTIKSYDGTRDPANHVRTFSNALLLQPVNNAIKCRAFPQTLSGMAQRWYSRLPPNSIGSLRDLSQAFIKQFISGKVHEIFFASLMSIVQGANESLKNYLNQFTKEAFKVQDLDDKGRKIYPGGREHEKIVINNEPAGGKNRKTDKEYSVREKYPRVEKDIDSASKKGGPGQKFTEYTRLNAPKSQILTEIEKYRDVRWPKPLRNDPGKLDKSKYCRFHKDAAHYTDECHQLKDEIEFLIRKGRLSKYTGDGEKHNSGRKNFDDRSSKNSRKAYAREVMHIVGEVPKRDRV
ncbi:uncharacterized protein LOC141715169 [Apium graveolens]|uniref:uncharacterized protein LOC141715169 n=1 Tax=Apium graveolens TaxID=4045 RepID=UPI003D7BB410